MDSTLSLLNLFNLVSCTARTQRFPRHPPPPRGISTPRSDIPVLHLTNIKITDPLPIRRPVSATTDPQPYMYPCRPRRTHLSSLCALPAPTLDAVLSDGVRAASLLALIQAASDAAVSAAALRALVRSAGFAARARVRRHPAGRLVAAAEPIAADDAEGAIELLDFVDRLDCSLRCSDVDTACERPGVRCVTSSNLTSVWSAGRNESGCGARGTEGDVNVMSATAAPASGAGPGFPFVTVAAGGRHSAAVTAGGELFVSGSNENGQLGLGHFDSVCAWTRVDHDGGCDATRGDRSYDACTTWERRRHPARIASISCGLRHTIVTTGAGAVLTCGDNERGQCGVGTSRQLRRTHQTRYEDLGEDAEVPSRVTQLTAVRGVDGSTGDVRWLGGVAQVAAGLAISLVLLADGRVFAAGQSEQLGLACVAEFTRVDCFGHKIVRVAVGGTDTVMLVTANTMVLVTGKRTSGLSVIGGLGCGVLSHLSIGDGFAIARTQESDVVFSRNRKRFELSNEFLDIYASAVSAGVRFNHCSVVTLFDW
jgi:alpha-tubulin suppressor-like RCC1 family protein